MAKRERRIIQRLERCHTLKHRSWLNIAENKLRSINHQCIKRRRFGTIRQLREETMAWYYCKRSIPDGFYVGITKNVNPPLVIQV